MQQLRQQLTGSLVTHEDKAYDKQRTPWLQVLDQYPAAIVNALTLHDIVTVVRLASELDLPLAVQNTGHGIALPCNGGILLRLSEMASVTVDAAGQTATVQPGVESGDLLAAAEPHGLAYASGQVSNVGVIGYTLGGGLGWIGRKVGVACHAMKSATVVLANGSVVEASATQNPDLFWALQGGGGNFGVVASLTVGLVPLGRVFGGMAYYRIKDASEVLRFYREWSATLGNETSTILRLTKLPPQPSFLLHGLTETCAIGVCHTGESTAEALHAQLWAFKHPSLDELAFRPYSEMASFDQASNLEGSPTFGHLECLRELTDGVIDDLGRLAKSQIPPLFQIELQQLGGELKAERADTTAYTAPQAPFFLHVVSPAMNTTLEQLARATREAYNSLGPVFTGEVSYNFLRGDQQARVPDAFTPEKYVRLQALKRQYDPRNLFRLNMNIPPLEFRSARYSGEPSK